MTIIGSSLTAPAISVEEAIGARNTHSKSKPPLHPNSHARVEAARRLLALEKQAQERVFEANHVDIRLPYAALAVNINTQLQ